MEKIFLLGSERSGTNLIRTLLGNHSKIVAPIAPHLGDTFISQYRNYIEHASVEELLKDIIKYLNHPFNDWDVSWDPNELKASFKTNNFIQIWNQVYTQKAIDKEAEAYFCKDNHNHKYALGILKEYPNAKFLYLQRDPRDHVASWMRNPVHLHTPYKTIKKWNSEQRACLNLDSFYGVDMHYIKYEELVSKTEEVMSDVLNYLELPVEEKCFFTNKQNKEAEKHPLWKNINKPIKKDNYRKFDDVLSEKDVELIETISKDVIKILGYPFFTEAQYEFTHKYAFKFKNKMREYISKKRSKNFNDNKMKILRDKNKLVNSLFAKFENDTSN